MPKKADPEAQRDQFIETARQLGVDEDEAAFKAKLQVLVKQRPVAHKVTPTQRREIDGETAVENHPKPRTREVVQVELATAEAELAGWQERWDRYDGNNPDKYRSSIRRASRVVKGLKAELSRLP